MSAIDIICAPDGTLTAIWDDGLAPLASEGQATITRVSHVEPTEEGEWTADMSPINGPVLGPFPLRREALDAELVWLRETMGF
jgi:hypothetical protein